MSKVVRRTPVEDGSIITAWVDDDLVTVEPDGRETEHATEADAIAYHEHRARWYACRHNGGNGKLDDETEWVHERVNAGETLTDIGREIGVSPQALGRRLRRYRERLGLGGRAPYPGNRLNALRPGAYRTTTTRGDDDGGQAQGE